jgi:hypothetical protein
MQPKCSRDKKVQGCRVARQKRIKDSSGQGFKDPRVLGFKSPKTGELVDIKVNYYLNLKVYRDKILSCRHADL